MGEPAKGSGAMAAIVLAILGGGVVGALLMSPPWGTLILVLIMVISGAFVKSVKK